jgi:cob(I)alamin adenosyltransferase
MRILPIVTAGTHSSAGDLPKEHLNRLSDVLWLISRLLKLRGSSDATLRTKDQPGQRWSRAW